MRFNPHTLVVYKFSPRPKRRDNRTKTKTRKRGKPAATNKEGRDTSRRNPEMRHISLSSSIKVALLFSLSFTLTSSSSSSSFSLNPKPSFPFSLSSRNPSSQPPKATVADLLSLLGPEDQASKVHPIVARQLRSCFRFLVPFNSTSIDDDVDVKRRSMVSVVGQRRENEEDELILWPPSSVLELARLSVDSGGDPAVVHRALDPTIIPVPDVEGSKECKCHLTRTPYGWHFINDELNAYLVFLFDMIASRGPSVGLDVSLNRYDFFHGHLFLAKDTGRLGILFHAKEYPAYDKKVFPYNMGYCQRGSDLAYDSTMNLRNILWLAPMPSDSSKAWAAPGVLVVLDARPDGIIYRDLIPDYVQFVRTLYEEKFGELAVDVNYLNVGGTSPNYQIFLC
ncbi:uncharacterized protein LOC110736855 isoform X1 [Chenopodium quinoa]|uniref:uncharacterized protein LOC110736855 isoform X1 n=1 Tax=Chenopodium quinoa TaxID=63459 RepID=UPI000B786073|nr:uncharacterized protein LOC110736855 isoform X1 [Chenopodium quinoa]